MEVPAQKKPLPAQKPPTAAPAVVDEDEALARALQQQLDEEDSKVSSPASRKTVHCEICQSPTSVDEIYILDVPNFFWEE